MQSKSMDWFLYDRKLVMKELNNFVRYIALFRPMFSGGTEKEH